MDTSQDLESFNEDLQGKIEIVKAFLEEAYIMLADVILAKRIADLAQ